MNCGNTNENAGIWSVTIAVESQFKQLRSSSKKRFFFLRLLRSCLNFDSTAMVTCSFSPMIMSARFHIDIRQVLFLRLCL